MTKNNIELSKSDEARDFNREKFEEINQTVHELKELKIETSMSWKDPMRQEGNEEPWPWNPDRRPWYNYDEKWFVKWNFPFKDIENPYKKVPSYGFIRYVERSRILPNISYKDLAKTWMEWQKKKLTVNDSYKTDYINKGTKWWKLNNPCDVSCGPNSVHAIWLVSGSWETAWDGQVLARYKSPVYWLASHMKMIREFKLGNEYLYRDRSIQWIICNWMQWFYRADEDKSLKAMRLLRISDAVNKINKNKSDVKINRYDRIDTGNKESLMAFTQITAESETWCKFSRKTLEKAYDLAFHKK